MTKDNKLIDDKVDNKIDDDLIDNLLKGYQKPEDLIGENGLLKQLTKRLLERAMAAELTGHVGYEKHDAAGQNRVVSNILCKRSFLVLGFVFFFYFI